MKTPTHVLLAVAILAAAPPSASAQTPPRLTVVPDGPLSSVRLRYLAEDGFTLEESSTVAGGPWTPVNAGASRAGADWEVVLPATESARFYRLRQESLTTITETSPLDGETGVAVTRETILRLSAPLAPDSALTTNHLYATFGGRRILSRLELSGDRRRATLFYLEPLPGSARVNVFFDSAGLKDARGWSLDPSGTGTPGGLRVIQFDTLSLTPLGQTAVIGRVLAAELTPGGGGAPATNRPLAGVTITVDGMEETLRTTTDALGNFKLEPVPPGRFFVHIDGRTAQGSSYPRGAYYPFVGKAWEAVAGKTNNLAGGTGEIFLPLIQADTLQPVSATNDTIVSFPAAVVAANPALADVRVTVPANSLYSDDGTRGGRVGIAPVPPDRLPGPLPPGVEIPLVITVQTDGALNFDQPAAICFPNLPDPSTGKPLPAGSRQALLSFNHKKGLWEAAGEMTVSADGKLVCSDPGSGIRQPGWHGIIPLPQSPPPPSPKDYYCVHDLDRYSRCTEGCLLETKVCTASALVSVFDAQKRCQELEDPVLNAACQGFLDAWYTQTLASCESRFQQCLHSCDACFIQSAPEPSFGPADPVPDRSRGTGSKAAPPPDDPVADQLVPILQQILELGRPFARSFSPIPPDLRAKMEDLRRQADSLAGGDSVGYLRDKGIADEDLLAANGRAIGFEPEDLNPGNAPPYPVNYVATIARPNGLFQLRGETGPFGQYALFVPRDGTVLNVSFHDPRTKSAGSITPNLSPGSRYRLPRFNLSALTGAETDTDQDGLGNLAEYVQGTDPTRADTDGDGIPDGAEMEQGTNPLDGFVARTGVIATARTPGPAVDVWTGNDVVATAEGAAGLSLFNRYSGSNPTILSHVPVSGDAQRISGSGSFLVAACGEAGAAILDITDPARARIMHQVPLAGSQAVAADAARAFVGLKTGSLVVIDLRSGLVLERVSLQGAVADLVVDGDHLYVLTGDRLDVYAIGGANLQRVGSAAVPWTAAPNRRLFVGGGFAYTVHAKGFNTLDVTNPAQPLLLSRGETTQFGWADLVANGSGLGVAAVGPNLTDDGPRDVQLYDLTNPRANNTVITTVPTPGQARAVSILNGLAYVADGTAGFQVVNYLPYDSKGLAPRIELKPGFGTNGVEAGRPVRVTALATDDVQVRHVEFYVDGTRLGSDGNFPFGFRFTAPLRTAGKTNFIVQAQARDTGGNSAWSAEMVVPLLPDVTPPAVAMRYPARYAAALDRVLVSFGEQLDAGSITNGSLTLRGAGPDGVPGSPDDPKIDGNLEYLPGLSRLEFRPSAPLPMGTYRAMVSGQLTDRSGNPLGTDYAWDIVVTEAVYWSSSAGGSWGVGSNWSTGQVPAATNKVVIDPYPSGVTIEISNQEHSVQSLLVGGRLQINGGTLNVKEGLEIRGRVELQDGRVRGAAITQTGAGRLLAGRNGYNVLENVALNGDLDLSHGGHVVIENGLRMAPESRLIIDNFGGASFAGVTTLTQGTALFTGDSGYLGALDGSKLTLGTNFVVRGRSGNVGQRPLFVRTASLVNLGRVVAESAGGTLNLNAQSLENFGVIEGQNGGSIAVQPERFLNAGTLRNGGGGRLTVNSGSWTNVADIRMTGGSLSLIGVFTNAGIIASENAAVSVSSPSLTLGRLGSVTRSGGTFQVSGTLDLQGGTLSLDDVRGTWLLTDGTIRNGTVAQSGSGRLAVDRNGFNLLDGVTLTGDLDLSNGGKVVVANGLGLSPEGRVIINNFGGATFLGETTLAQGSVVFGGDSGYLVPQVGGSLTIGPGFTVRGRSGFIGRRPFSENGTYRVVNRGTISADSAGGTLTINAVPFVNEGTLEEKNGGRVVISN